LLNASTSLNLRQFFITTFAELECYKKCSANTRISLATGGTKWYVVRLDPTKWLTVDERN
jgi:hypothetical protein